MEVMIRMSGSIGIDRKCAIFNRAAVMLAVLALLSCGTLAHAKQIVVVFRYDDISNGSNTDVDMRVLAAFQDRKVPITFSVIPFCGSFPKEAGQPDPSPLSEAKAWMLRRALSAGGFEVAQHGYSHEDARAGQPGGSSEFLDDPYEKQFERMVRGKRHLERVLDSSVVSFVPPWNTYDEQTVRVAKTLGFRVFSPGGPDAALQAKYHMPFVGCCQSLTTLKQRIGDARKSADPRPLVPGLFHIFQISDYNKQYGEFTFAELESLLDWVKDQRDIKCMTITNAAKALNRKDPLR